MKHFEYKILTNKAFKKSLMNEEYFNKLGKEGWELISLSFLNESAYFKREVQNLYALYYLYILIIINDASSTYVALPISHPNPPHSAGNVEATKVIKKPNPKRRRTIALNIF